MGILFCTVSGKSRLTISGVFAGRVTTASALIFNAPVLIRTCAFGIATTPIPADFASSLPVKAVLDLVQAAASAKQQTISHSLLRMLTKLADHADQGQTTVRANADETFRSAVNDLLTDWTLEDPNPDAYTMVLDQLSMPAEAAPEAGEAPDHLAEAPRILQMALELDVVGEAVWTSLARVIRDGRLELLMASLNTAPPDSIGTETI